jgi:sugar-phosphatase
MPTLTASALLFDMDGVLVDSRPVVERVWRRWAERTGRPGDHVVAMAHGRRSIETIGMVAPDLDTDAEAAWLDEQELLDTEGILAIPGAAEFVASLPRDRWALVTSARDDLARLRLRVCGIPTPDVLVSSDAVERGKPAPDGFLIGAERLGVAPGECLVFEDAPPGIEAAKRAGMRVVGLPTTHERHLLDTDVVIQDFTHAAATFADGALRIEIAD